MIFYILTLAIVVKLYLLANYFSKREKKNCFTEGNFDAALKYAIWKQQTSNPGTVSVGRYWVEVSPEEELLFKKGDEHYTVFKVNREDGIVIMAVKHRESMKWKAENAFCELLKMAIFHTDVPKEDLPL